MKAGDTEGQPASQVGSAGQTRPGFVSPPAGHRSPAAGVEEEGISPMSSERHKTSALGTVLTQGGGNLEMQEGSSWLGAQAEA